MDIVKHNSMVEIAFTLGMSNGEIIDSSEKDGPLKYIHGQKRITPILEEALTGKKTGDNFKVVVEPKDAYGERDDSLVQLAQKELFGAEFDKIQVGMPLELGGPDGQTKIVTAVDIREDGILFDANHPLAGETLTFDVNVLSVRESTEDELAELQKASTCKTGCC